MAIIPTTKRCKMCSANMTRRSRDTYAYWNTRTYCSIACRAKDSEWLAKMSVVATKRNIKLWNDPIYADHMSRVHKGKTGERASNWKGAKVGYSGIHKWLRTTFGAASGCAFCGADKGNFQWANISHQYLRDRGDWEPLCISCHKKYDLDFIRNHAHV